MNKIQRTANKLFGCCGFMVINVLLVNTAFSHDYRFPTPKDFDKYIVMIGGASYPSVDGSAFLDGLIAGDGMNFQQNVMGRSEFETEQNMQQAIYFFTERFGLDVADFQNVYFSGFQMDPRNNLRVHVVSNENVPIGGWEIIPGGWLVFVTNPNGMELGGQFEGVHVGPGTVFVVAELKIARDNGREPLILRRRSLNPVSPHPGVDTVARFLVNDELYIKEYGFGRMTGVSSLTVDEKGVVDYRVNVVMTIPKKQHLAEK